VTHTTHEVPYYAVSLIAYLFHIFRQKYLPKHVYFKGLKSPSSVKGPSFTSMNMTKYSAHRNYKIYHSFKLSLNYEAVNNVSFFFPVPVCAITASGVPGGTFVSMNRFSTLCG
jgi:hypothetical protein